MFRFKLLHKIVLKINSFEFLEKIISNLIEISLQKSRFYHLEFWFLELLDFLSFLRF